MKEILEKIKDVSEAHYKEFITKLTYTDYKILGVRSPSLKKIAKEIYEDGNYKEFIKELPHTYHEENMIHTYLFLYFKDVNYSLNQLDIFLHFIDNWGVCDSLVSSLKLFKKEKETIKDKIDEYLSSPYPFIIRFAVVFSLVYYIESSYFDEYLIKLTNINNDHY